MECNKNRKMRNSMRKVIFENVNKNYLFAKLSRFVNERNLFCYWSSLSSNKYLKEIVLYMIVNVYFISLSFMKNNIKNNFFHYSPSIQ